jgi:hypothetical protein
MRRAIAALVLIGVAVAVIADTSPEFQVPMTRSVLFVAGTIAVVLVFRRTAAMTASGPERFDAELSRSPAQPPEVDAFRTIEFSLRMATVHPLGVEWLRPTLRDLAAWKLLSRRGVNMARDPEAARRMLGEPLSRLVEPATASGGPGITRVTLSELNAGLDALDQL